MSFKNYKILFKFPVRNRKEKLFSALDKYYENMIDKENFQFAVSIDEDDIELNTKEVISRIQSYKNAKCFIDKGEGKIHACNRDIDKISPETYDIIILVSDDMIPIKKGFDMIIRKDMEKNFPDLDGVLWYNDGHQRQNLNTLCILGKKYYERFGYIYHPSYKSLYCDNEFMEVSKMLNKVKYYDLVIIEHQHWAWGFREMDSLYKENETFIKPDRETFLKRKEKNFEI